MSGQMLSGVARRSQEIVKCSQEVICCGIDRAILQVVTNKEFSRINEVTNEPASMKLEELQVYQLAMLIGDKIWRIVDDWSYFVKDAFGKQLIRSADSIAANIAEGYGRYHYKENLNFCYYSRGSLRETVTWLTKALNRNLISWEKFTELNQLCELLSVKLNNYIKTIGNGSR